MKLLLSSLGLLAGTLFFAQATSDTVKSKEIESVTLIARKPTVENKTDRTVFNVANSSILAGNTTWDILRMTPMVSIDNNDNIKAEGVSVTVYINDRKSVFTGKELKEYLKTIPADNLMKIEVITSPSSRYETSGEVINIVLKKRDDEGIKGSATFTNTQNRKNSQYANFNVNYHKKNFTQTLTGSYGENTMIMKNYNENRQYEGNKLTLINTESKDFTRSPSFSSTSEIELNDKNNLGFILEYFQNNKKSSSNAEGMNYANDVFTDSYFQNQNLAGMDRSIGSNLFYKYYDKEKNKILDVNFGINYNANADTNNFNLQKSTKTTPYWTQIVADNESRNYYLKVDYSQPVGKSGKSSFEVGAKIDFNNNVIPYDLFGNNEWLNSMQKSEKFQYTDNLSSAYGNFSKTFFEKLETRIGVRVENISYKIKLAASGTERSDSYSSFLPNLLLKYSFSDNYNLSATYNRNIWRPGFSEFNPFLLPSNDGTFYRGNLDLLPNPSNRISLKLGLFKKYFISTSYWFSNQDYWTTYQIIDGRNITLPANFIGRVERYSVNVNTNQTFLKNKLNVNVNLGVNYIDNSDFNTRNQLNARNYTTNFGGSSNLSYTNLFNKNININGWFGVYMQNGGNSYGNRANFYHTISMTKIFSDLGMEASLQLNNIFMRPNFDSTTFTPIGTFRNSTMWDWHGFSLTFIKRFGNQKVKENTKTDVEKNAGGGK